METKKMIWGNPELDVQKFVPQYCAGPCTNKEGDKVYWTAKCNSAQSLVFYMDGKVGPHGGVPNDWIWDTSRGGCGQTHTFEMTAGDPITANSKTLPGVDASNWNSTWRNTSGIPGVTSNSQLWNGYELKAAYREYLLDAYYNDECIGGGLWLVTNDLQHFHIVS